MSTLRLWLTDLTSSCFPVLAATAGTVGERRWDFLTLGRPKHAAAPHIRGQRSLSRGAIQSRTRPWTQTATQSRISCYRWLLLSHWLYNRSGFPGIGPNLGGNLRGKAMGHRPAAAIQSGRR